MPYLRAYSGISRDTALAAYAAWDQGKFWEMHDLLFERQDDIMDRSDVDTLARELGLDMSLYAKNMDEQKHLEVLQRNLELIHDLDIWSTPTTIINGKMIKGAQSYETYKQIIEAALGQAGEHRGTGARFLALLGRILSPPDLLADQTMFGKGKVPMWVPAPVLKPVNGLSVGDPAPDFTLPSAGGGDVTLSSFEGKKNVLLTFLPAAFTPT